MPTYQGLLCCGGPHTTYARSSDGTSNEGHSITCPNNPWNRTPQDLSEFKGSDPKPIKAPKKGAKRA